MYYTLLLTKDMLNNGQFRMDAVKKYLVDSAIESIDKLERGEFARKVKDAVDEPLPVQAPVGLLSRVANVFV